MTDDWQPIETAPRDGTPFWWISGKKHVDWGRIRTRRESDGSLTLWMEYDQAEPLPDPPASTGAG